MQSVRKLIGPLVVIVFLTVASGTCLAADESVYAAQERLQQLGYDPGPLDGTFGGRTRAALKKFQVTKGLPQTGELDTATATALGVNVDGPTAGRHTRPTSSEAGLLRLRLHGNSISTGSVPLMLLRYDKNGNGVSSGMSRISTVLRDVVLNLEELPRHVDPWSPKLGIQLEGEEQIAIVAVRRRKADHVFLDKNGIAWPDDVNKVPGDGPTITLTFLSPDHKVIALTELSVSVTTGDERALKTDLLEHQILRVRGVPDELLTVLAKDSKTGKSWSIPLFPKFRAADKDVILYSLLKVPVGRTLESDPTYEESERPAAESEAVRALRRACDAGTASKCNELAVRYTKGREVSLNPKEAARYYRRACDLGDAIGCSNLGGAYAIGDGVTKDYKQALDLFRQGCTGGDAGSCFNVGSMFTNGYGVNVDKGAAGEFFKKACDFGLEQGCTYFQRFK